MPSHLDRIAQLTDAILIEQLRPALRDAIFDALRGGATRSQVLRHVPPRTAVRQQVEAYLDYLDRNGQADLVDLSEAAGHSDLDTLEGD